MTDVIREMLAELRQGINDSAQQARDASDDLRALADECREWSRELLHPDPKHPTPTACCAQFGRIADKLDAIANRLAP